MKMQSPLFKNLKCQDSDSRTSSIGPFWARGPARLSGPFLLGLLNQLLTSLLAQPHPSLKSKVQTPLWLHALAFYTSDTPRNFHFLIHQTCSCRFSQTLVSFWTFFSLSEYFANSCSSCKTKGMTSSVRIPLITLPWLDLITALVPNLIYTCSFPAPGKDICYMCLPSIPFFLAVVVSTSLFHRVLPSWRRDC